MRKVIQKIRLLKYTTCFMILASFDIYASENSPSLEQTEFFISSVLSGKYWPSACRRPKEHQKPFKEKVSFTEDELVFVSSHLQCISTIRITLAGLENIYLSANDKILLSINCNNGKRCISEITEFYIHDVRPKNYATQQEMFDIGLVDTLIDVYSGEWKWKEQRPRYRDYTSFGFGEYSNENLKLSKRTFNALKHYSSFYTLKAKFEDKTFFQVDGSEFD